VIRRIASMVFMAFCAVYIIAPIIVVSGSALNGGRTMLFPPRDPTLKRFGEFFLTEDVWVTSLQNSLIIAVGSATIAVLIAWPVAYAVWRHAGRVSQFIAGLASLPFALPPIVFGVGLGFLWAYSGGLGTIWSGILSHAAFFLALPLVTISIGLQSIDEAHIDAAATMGANERQTFLTIIFPQMIPYTVSGFFFALVLSFNEFIIMFFVASSSFSTVTLQIFNSLRNGFTPTMAVGAITFIVTSVLVFSVVAWFGNLPRLLGADQSRSE